MKVEIIELKDTSLLSIVRSNFDCYKRNYFPNAKVLFKHVTGGKIEGLVDGGVQGYFDIIFDHEANRYKHIPAE